MYILFQVLYLLSKLILTHIMVDIQTMLIYTLYTKLYLHTITGTKLFRVKRKSSSDSKGEEEAEI